MKKKLRIFSLVASLMAFGAMFFFVAYHPIGDLSQGRSIPFFVAMFAALFSIMDYPASADIGARPVRILSALCFLATPALFLVFGSLPPLSVFDFWGWLLLIIFIAAALSRVSAEIISVKEMYQVRIEEMG
ncbi:MAG: hypothetical protein NTX66_04655 [Candidatus Falkowbacteria bacterium]|nr:hypothetical protein [Candidatus Falkowbacteria bacterium]